MSKSQSKGPPGQSPPGPRGQSTVYHLREEHDGLTLSAALRALMDQSSWGQTKKWIANRHVQVNGNLCLDEARRVSSKDVIKLWQHPLPKPVEASDLRIAHLDDHLLVVEKPAGITSVRHFAERKLSTRRRQLQPTLEELLPRVLAKMQRLRWPPLPPVGMNRGRSASKRRRPTGNVQNAKKLPPELQVFPVHRLDRDTSGLMLFARTRAAEQKLVSLFRRHAVVREYVALCSGEIPPQSIRSLLVRDRGDGLRGSLPADAAPELREGALEAITHILSSETLGHTPENTGYSLLRCKLETGRTHQIRIHLSEAGHPICGDKTYPHPSKAASAKDGSHPPRQALHSDHLEFTHPFTGQSLSFHMPLPKDLAQWLKRLRG